MQMHEAPNVPPESQQNSLQQHSHVQRAQLCFHRLSRTLDISGIGIDSAPDRWLSTELSNGGGTDGGRIKMDEEEMEKETSSSGESQD